MDKISDYIGKQRKNSDGECDTRIPRFYSALISKMVEDCRALRGSFCFLLVCGPVEADPEYKLIVAANNLTVEIDNELSEFLKHFLKHFCRQR